jgi:hypothetical protein
MVSIYQLIIVAPPLKRRCRVRGPFDPAVLPPPLNNRPI